MVSWNNTNDGRADTATIAPVDRVVAAGGGEGIASAASSESIAQIPNGAGTRLFDLARQELWEEFLTLLEDSSPEMLLGLEEANSVEGDSLLHVVLSYKSAPLEVIETMITQAQVTHPPSRQVRDRIDRTEEDSSRVPREPNQTKKDPSGVAPNGYNSICAAKNYAQQTPLHVAVISVPGRTEVVEALVRANPEIVYERDKLRLRPIDILTQKMIMMEEAIKYFRNKSFWQKEEALLEQAQIWETAHVLAQAMAQTSVVASGASTATTALTHQPMVHACLRGKDVPFALTERVMKRNKAQLTLPDANGDLPLHVVARVKPKPRLSQGFFRFPSRNGEKEHDDNDDDDDSRSNHSEIEDDEGDFLDRVLSLNPRAASHFNQQQQLPLNVAIQSGRRWTSGVFRLLQAYPAGLEEVQLPHALYPVVLSKFARAPDTLYGILQSQPGLFRR